jgi:hypothetical protein
VVQSTSCLCIHYPTHARCPNNGSMALCMFQAPAVQGLKYFKLSCRNYLEFDSQVVIKRQHHMPQSFVHQRWLALMVAGSYQLLNAESTYILDSESISPFLSRLFLIHHPLLCLYDIAGASNLLFIHPPSTMSSKMLPRTTTALISVSTSTVSPKTLTSISNKLILQQSSRKLIVDLPPNKTVEEKSISKPGGLVYRSSRRIAGFLFNKPNSELSPAHDQLTCTLENFERFHRIMIAKFGKDPDTYPFIAVAVCGGKVEDQTARVVLKLSVGGMRDHGRFRQVTLRVRFTDGNDSSSTYFTS